MISVALALVVVLAIAIPVALAIRQKKVVVGNSLALAELERLNGEYKPQMRHHPPIRHRFMDAVNSKAKFDRYDLGKFFLSRLAAMEGPIQQQVDERLADAATFSAYATKYERLAELRLGRSRSDGLSAKEFERIERKLFNRRRLREPKAAADVRCEVTYTSPQGQNSYRKWLDFDFVQLRQGLEEMRRIRDLRTTTQFLRQQERNRLTVRMRAQILKRDQYRCRMCGATPDHGATLHVDHIFPVSRGGTTTPDNLQTLCQDCNLGKGNVL